MLAPSDLEDKILAVLAEAGRKGLSIKKTSIHVYNMSASFFDELTFEEVWAAVARYLGREGKKRGSYVARATVRGRYRLSSAGRCRVRAAIERQASDEAADSAVASELRCAAKSDETPSDSADYPMLFDL